MRGKITGILMGVVLLGCQVLEQEQQQEQVQTQLPIQLQAQTQSQAQGRIQQQEQEQQQEQQQLQQQEQVQSQEQPQVPRQMQSQPQPQVQTSGQVHAQSQIQVQQQAPEYMIPGQGDEINSFHKHLLWNQILNHYVSETGQVNYTGIKKDRSSLDQYLHQLKENPVQDSWSRAQQLAYWINAYNAFTVDLILDHYPVESIRDIQHPWDKRFIALEDQMYSLNQIENDIIRPVFKEPRIHFALVCAAVSCPKLLNSAYLSESLDQQLESQTRYFINQSGKNELSEDHVKISQLFNWYEKDFKRQGTILDFIDKYTDQEISDDAEVEYLHYDWSLNE